MSTTSTASERPMHTTIENGVAKVLLDRKPVNAFNFALYGQVMDTFAELAARDDVGCLLLGSALDKAFSAGADINDFKAQAAKPDSGQARAPTPTGFQHACRQFPHPTVLVRAGSAAGVAC